MEEEVRAAVFGNVGTMVTFRVGAFDAEVLEKEFAPEFTAEDLVNLGIYQTYLKLMIDGVSSAPFSATTLPPIEKPLISYKNEIINASRKKFARPRPEIEAEIRDWHQPIKPPERPVGRIDNNLPSDTEPPRKDYRKDRPIQPDSVSAPQSFKRPERREEKPVQNQSRDQVRHPTPSFKPPEPSVPISLGSLRPVDKKHDNRKREEQLSTLKQALADVLKQQNRPAVPGGTNQNQDQAKQPAKNPPVKPADLPKNNWMPPKPAQEIPEDILKQVLSGTIDPNNEK
jgi:hypothetical protein